MTKKLFFAVLAVLAVLSPAGGRLCAEAGVGLSPWDPTPRKEKPVRKPDRFITVLAERMAAGEEELAGLWNGGYGRNELIKLLLISKQSGQELREIIRQRKKGAKLSGLAEKYKLEYRSILNEAEQIRRDIDFTVLSSTQAILHPKVSVSGSTDTEKNDQQ